MIYNTLTEKQVALDEVLDDFHRTRLATWSSTTAEKVASQLDGLLQDEYGHRHRVVIVTNNQGYQPPGIYKARAIGGEVELHQQVAEAPAYSLLNVTRIEFVRSQIPGLRTPTQTDDNLLPLTEAEAKRILKK